ncbi:type II/IV secretion system ATPase subunit [Methanospirillum hungatei]|uniref:type II/IV secretion system ATPase subunit n=2 Tax=Methanospirillum hungatei TaxID=2203 RepID=UPI0026ED936C|nr:type II/IV secretion system ATPase subunit [Methanospirillum hungatei]MCA1915304.1 type II/IV secretion system ATPase subunit [Methanospirillum hungatei]
MSRLQIQGKIPFQEAESHDTEECIINPESCALYRMLPANAKEYARNYPHLLEYLHIFPVDEFGIPLFFSELKRDLKGIKDPNLIYPAKPPIFIHIFFDPNDVRNFYIPIEPSFMHNIGRLLPAIEYRLVDLLDALEEDPVTPEERTAVLKRLLRQVMYIKKAGEAIDPSLLKIEGPKGFGDKLKTFLTTDLTAKEDPSAERLFADVPHLSDGRIIVSPQEYEAIEYQMIRDKIDVGLLYPFISDNFIEDITCDGLGPIFIEHKIFKGLKSVVGFDQEAALDDFCIKLAEKSRRPITYRNPIVDATLPDGSRINIVYSTEISRQGSNFTIRKAMDDVISITKLVEFGTCSYALAAYLWICIENGMSLFMSGETASGKTTSMNALTTFISPESKIVSIEDTPELIIPHKNWTREVSKGKGKGEGEGSDVTMFDLLRAALRQRPNMIMVGEIRGVEGAVAFGAMQTGHPVMSTFHAATVEKLIQRLTGDPILIPKTFIDNLNLVVIQSAVRRPDGAMVRRQLNVSELVGYDAQSGGFSFVEVFTWDPVTDTHEFTGKGSSYLLENKIATMLGIPEHKKAQMYMEVEKRAKILERLHKAGYTDFIELFLMITKLKKQGLLNIDI